MNDKSVFGSWMSGEGDTNGDVRLLLLLLLLLPPPPLPLLLLASNGIGETHELDVAERAPLPPGPGDKPSDT